MRKFWSISSAAYALALGLALTLAAPAPAATLDLAQALSERVLGDKDAPVTIQSFESLTCSHCAAFEKETMPKIKKAYIDTGQVKFVFNDFPLDSRAMVAAMVARCVAPERYFGMLKLLFTTQETWAAAQTKEAFLDSLGRVARQGGMTEEQFTACINNEALYNGIRERVVAADKQHRIDSTPTFLIGDQRIVGAQPFSEFKKIIDPMLPNK